MNKKTAFILLLISIPIVVVYSKMGEASKSNPRNATVVTMPDALSVEEKVNKHRISFNINKLEHDKVLCDFAQKRVDRMVGVDWVATPHPFMEEDHRNSPVSDRLISENVGSGFNEDVVVEGWLNSKGHREAIENKGYTKTCVATNKSLIVQIFAEK